MTNINTEIETFGEYQTESRKTAQYPNVGNNIIYPTLGLAGECGEVCEKIKKLIRDKNSIVDNDFKKAISEEISDVFWYLAALCSELGISMTDVARLNLRKLSDRLERGKIKGEGDNR